MKKVLLICLTVTAVIIAGSMTAKAAEHKHHAAQKAEAAPVLQELTVVGTVEKIEEKKQNGTGTKTVFKLTDADGTEVYLPRGQIEQYVGKKVKVTGKGSVAGNLGTHIKTITKIELADAAPAAPAK